MVEHAEKRDDARGEIVKGRLEPCNDLVAEEAVYHPLCMTKFKFAADTDKKQGRAVYTERMDSFEKICK